MKASLTIRLVVGLALGGLIALSTACSDAPEGAVRTAAPAEEVRYFLFDTTAEIDQAAADLGGGTVPCCDSAVALFSGPDGAALRIEVAPVEGSPEASEPGEPRLTVSAEEHAARGTLVWSDNLFVSLVLTGVAQDRSEDELARLAGLLEASDQDPQVAGLSLPESSGYTEIARRRSDAAMTFGRGGTVHATVGGQGGTTIEFREAPFSSEHVELNLPGFIAGFVDSVGERRVLLSEATTRTPATAWFLEDGYLVSVASQVHVEQLRELVSSIVAESAGAWSDVRTRLADAVRGGELLFYAQVDDDLGIEVFASNDVPVICASRSGNTSCEQAFSVAPTVGAVALGSDAWVFGYSDELMGGLTVNGASPDVHTTQAGTWFISAIPNEPATTELRVGELELEVLRPVP